MMKTIVLLTFKFNLAELVFVINYILHVLTHFIVFIWIIDRTLFLFCFFVFDFVFVLLPFITYLMKLQSPDMQSWQNDYLQGTGCEMYTESLSPSFAGMSFPQASE